MDNPNADSSNKIQGHLNKGLEAGAGHVAALNSLTDELQKKNKSDTQGMALSHVGEEGLAKTRTWTRVVRFAQKGDAQAKAKNAGISKRSFMEIDGCEIPNKRRLVDHVSQKKLSMVEAAGQPRQEQ